MNGTHAEDIAHVKSLGLGVDDDNEPAPENIPNKNPPEKIDQSWGWDGFDHH